MIKTILIGLLGLFFILNGINHFYNDIILEEYAAKRRLMSPKLMVKLAGVLLIGGGISLMIPPLRLFGIIGLSIFLIIAGFTIHRFWEETDRHQQWLEAMHFTKNLAILTELIYIAVS